MLFRLLYLLLESFLYYPFIKFHVQMLSWTKRILVTLPFFFYGLDWHINRSDNCTITNSFFTIEYLKMLSKIVCMVVMRSEMRKCHFLCNLGFLSFLYLNYALYISIKIIRLNAVTFCWSHNHHCSVNKTVWSVISF